MAAKKKTRKKQTKAAGKKKLPAKKLAKKLAKKKLAKKKPANKPARKKAPVKTKAAGKKTSGARKAVAPKKRPREKSQSVDTVKFPPEVPAARSGRQSGDLQGLSNVEDADSESVDELLEEGNAFEADIVSGVEDAGGSDGREVHTHEVPQDDVPEEYEDQE
jgi:hypothetical protein